MSDPCSLHILLLCALHGSHATALPFMRLIARCITGSLFWAGCWRSATHAFVIHLQAAYLRERCSNCRLAAHGSMFGNSGTLLNHSIGVSYYAGGEDDPASHAFKKFPSIPTRNEQRRPGQAEHRPVHKDLELDPFSTSQAKATSDVKLSMYRTCQRMHNKNHLA